MLRLTGGEFRGRTIQTPSSTKTRPTQAKLRQALFNSLQAHVQDAPVLDLFAASGALGFQALSRGAQKASFVEESRAAIKMIEKNAEHLGVKAQVQIVGKSLEDCLPILEKQGPFDLIFADPPYAEGWEIKLLETLSWESLLVQDGFFCLEWSSEKSRATELPHETSILVKVREKNYGDSLLTTYQAKRERV